MNEIMVGLGIIMVLVGIYVTHSFMANQRMMALELLKILQRDEESRQ